MKHPLLHWQDLPAALGLLSRLPIRVDPARAQTRAAAATWAYPLAGALIGALAGMAAICLATLGLPAPIQALGAVTTGILTTGALHEDGLADSADGLWGGWTPARRLEIMKDSHIGAYGVLAIGLTLLWRTALLTLLLPQTAALPLLIGLSALSRTPLPALMTWLPNARTTGLAHSVGTPETPTTALALIIGALIGLLTLGWLPLITAALATLIWAKIALNKVGGHTGDILGAAQQITEITILATLLAAMS